METRPYTVIDLKDFGLYIDYFKLDGVPFLSIEIETIDLISFAPVVLN